MKILIITGGSKGIGKAIAQKYASENYTVYTLSRSIVDVQNILQIGVDLTDLKETTKAFKMIFDTFKKESISRITFINNAGRLGKIAPVENLDSEDIAKTIQLNTTTPLVLSSLFIKLTQQRNSNKQLINISSGAAIKPYQGWVPYCASKAALDMMTKTIALEQSELKNGVKCVAIYPGVVDTEMQHHIRKSNEKDFKNVQRFIDLKENNELFTPDFVAHKIFEIDVKNQLKNGDIIDIRNL